MLTADAQFRITANAAAAAWRTRPAFVSYRADVHVVIPALGRDQTVSRAILSRTSDDRAILQDLPRGQNQVGQSFPLIPTFDALSYFRLDFHLGDPLRIHNPLSGVTMQAPLEYAPVTASHPEVTVVATSLRNYYAAYAADSSDRLMHVVMTPLPALTRNNESDFYLRDVYIDPTTSLPTRVTYRGPKTDFDCDYTTIGTSWIVNHSFYRRTLSAPLHIGQTTFTVDARYSEFAFPTDAPDPRLKP